GHQVDGWIDLAQGAEDFLHVGHHQVRQHGADLPPVATVEFHRLRFIATDQDAVAGGGEDFLEDGGEGFVTVNNKDQLPGAAGRFGQELAGLGRAVGQGGEVDFDFGAAAQGAFQLNAAAATVDNAEI